MRKRVAELEGAVLDYWAAMAEGLERACIEHEICWTERWATNDLYPFCPSKDWLQGGLIIEREGIMLARQSGPHCAEPWGALVGIWSPDYQSASDRPKGHVGPTPLIAAMRAYVASKFGDEVPGAAE